MGPASERPEISPDRRTREQFAVQIKERGLWTSGNGKVDRYSGFADPTFLSNERYLLHICIPSILKLIKSAYNQ